MGMCLTGMLGFTADLLECARFCISPGNRLNMTHARHMLTTFNISNFLKGSVFIVHINCFQS